MFVKDNAAPQTTQGHGRELWLLPTMLLTVYNSFMFQTKRTVLMVVYFGSHRMQGPALRWLSTSYSIRSCSLLLIIKKNTLTFISNVYGERQNGLKCGNSSLVLICKKKQITRSSLYILIFWCNPVKRWEIILFPLCFCMMKLKKNSVRSSFCAIDVSPCSLLLGLAGSGSRKNCRRHHSFVLSTLCGTRSSFMEAKFLGPSLFAIGNLCMIIFDYLHLYYDHGSTDKHEKPLCH